MVKSQRIRCWGHSVRRPATARPHLEWLESRDLPTALTGTTALVPLLDLPAGGPTIVVEGPNSEAEPQDLGVFAPAQLDSGITVVGGFQTETADYYQFQVSQTAFITIGLKSLGNAQGLLPGKWLTLSDGKTHQVQSVVFLNSASDPASEVNSDGDIILSSLVAQQSTYVVTVASWATNAGYTITFAMAGLNPEAPSTLSIAAAASIRLRLLNNGLSAAPAGITLPAALTSSSDSTQVVTVSYVVSGSSTNTTAPAGSSNIPASVYVALGAGPVGGFAGANGGNLNGATDVYDRIYGQSPALALSERFIGLAVLSQIGTASHVVVSEPAAPTATDRATQPTGLLKVDAAGDLEDDDLAPDDQVRATTEERFIACVSTRAITELGTAQRAETSTGPAPLRDQRAALSSSPQRVNAAIAVTVLFAALGERWRRQGRPALDIEV